MGAPLKIGTAGWSIPRDLAADYPGAGTHLQRYAGAFGVAEINSSFHRPHRPTTYERWAASVPPDFRFSVKLPKTITHQSRLVGCFELLRRFADEVSGLGDRRGPILVQLPPSLAYDEAIASAFFCEASRLLGPAIVCEPRHPSWFTAIVDRLLANIGVARVAADPAIQPEAALPGGSSGMAYFRLHGTPVVYRSSYDQEALDRQAAVHRQMRARGVECWTIFDNTAAGAALANASELVDRVCNA